MHTRFLIHERSHSLKVMISAELSHMNTPVLCICMHCFALFSQKGNTTCYNLAQFEPEGSSQRAHSYLIVVILTLKRKWKQEKKKACKKRKKKERVLARTVNHSVNVLSHSEKKRLTLKNPKLVFPTEVSALLSCVRPQR